MIWCQGAQNIGLSNYKLKSTPHYTIWSQCMPAQTNGWMDEHHGNSVTIGSVNASCARNVEYSWNWLQVW